MKFEIGQTVTINPKVRNVPVSLEYYFPFSLLPEMIRLGGTTAKIVGIKEASDNYVHRCLLSEDRDLENFEMYEQVRKLFPRSINPTLYSIKLDNGYFWPHWLLLEDLDHCSIY